MIRVARPAAVPTILATRGAVEDRRNRRLYRRHRAAFRDGSRTFDFDASIYGHPSVKQSLIAAQHGKCAFWEAKIRHISYGDVEHFRPKGGVRQTSSSPLKTPGYYWLAYEWTNLLLSCQLCNQRHKANHFPLEKGSRRSRFHGHDIALERSMFIDPAREDPEALIGFRENVPIALGDDPRARRTVRWPGLRRPELNEHRRERLAVVEALHALATANPRTSHAGAALAMLRKMTTPQGEYSLMVRTFLRRKGMSL